TCSPAVLRIDGAPDAGADAAFLAKQGHWTTQRLQKRKCQPSDELAIARFETQDNEFITTQPRNRIGRAHGIDQPGSRSFQQQITRLVPQAVVDEFEVVQVDEEN